VYYYWLHTVGPMVLWMADCGADCRTFNASLGNWFKIAQRGLLSGTIQEGMWGQKILGGDNWDGTPELWTETIPAALKPGNYLIRHEIIALHIANKPQWYPQCAHLTVTGSGTESPDKSYWAKIPGVYSMDRRLILEVEKILY
jgi:Auxiliary Activity family 9 (formerly GH61)